MKFGVKQQKRRVQIISVLSLDSLNPLYFFSMFLDLRKKLLEMNRMIVITIRRIAQTEMRTRRYLLYSRKIPRIRISVLINERRNTSDSSVKHEISLFSNSMAVIQNILKQFLILKYFFRGLFIEKVIDYYL